MIICRSSPSDQGRIHYSLVNLFISCIYNGYVTLSPISGFSAITTAGSGFAAATIIVITWDSTLIPTVPSPIVASQSGSFNAIISVPTQTTVGDYVITAISTLPGGATASTTFRVINMTGPQGLTGQVGTVGPQGPAGVPGEQGPIGATGTQGPAGKRGSVGAQQPTGVAAPPGAVGTRGKAVKTTVQSLAAIILALIALALTIFNKINKPMKG